MRRLTTVLLTGAYICLALMIALAGWRIGGGAGVALSGFVGSLAACFAIHGLIGRGLEARRLQDEVGALREANEILTDEIEKIQARVTQMVEQVSDNALRRSEEIYDEVQVLEDVVQQLGERLNDQLTLQLEAAETQAAPSPISSALMATVRGALEAGRVDLYLQAVVSLPQRRTQYYESFTRLRDESGRVLMPSEFLSVAEPGGLVAAIDNLLLFRCVQIVRRFAKQDRKIGIFCNISLASLGDEAFFPSFMEFLASNRDLADLVIFELGQSAFNARNGLQARNMGRLADLGFRFSIDKVSDLNIDFLDLARCDVGFVKVAASVLLEEIGEQDGQLIFRSLPEFPASEYIAIARRHGVELVAEKVESERQVVDILDLDIALGQGHLFGEPRAIRDQVLAEAPPAAELMQAALRRAG